MTSASTPDGDVLTWITAVLATTASRWVHLADRLPAALFTTPAGPGEWSAGDCLRHLLDAETLVFPHRLAVFQAGGESFPNFNPATDGTAYSGQTPSQLAAAFARARAENLAALEALTAADLARTARHGELGPVTLGEMLHEWAAHDLDHTIQAEDALMQPFMAGCGPWRAFFKAHDHTAGTGTVAPDAGSGQPKGE